ncbi:Vegetative incompatibility protein HET-E-1, partial [Lachnellula arida]
SEPAFQGRPESIIVTDGLPVVGRFKSFITPRSGWLGDKKSLERHFCEITGIPAKALQHTPLSQFSFTERMPWAEIREIIHEEDKAYTCLGIFDIQVLMIYGERRVNAHKRLCEKINNPLKGLDCLLSACDWLLNPYNKQHESTCLPDTGVDLLQEIYDWADGQDKRCILWLNGLAGTGKSTIAQTVAGKYYTEGHLGASFFFSRAGGDVGHARKFVTSIAARLAGSIPTVNWVICDAIREHSDVASRSFRDQWQQLVLRGLLKTRGNNCCASYVVVVPN